MSTGTILNSKFEKALFLFVWNSNSGPDLLLLRKQSRRDMGYATISMIRSNPENSNLTLLLLYVNIWGPDSLGKEYAGPFRVLFRGLLTLNEKLRSQFR